MSDTVLSLLAAFDDLCRCDKVLIDGEAEEVFLRFLKNQEECRLQWISSIEQSRRLQRELDTSLRNMADLETKLFHARRLLEMENKSRREAENERDQMEKKIIAAANLLKNDGGIAAQTRDKLAFLNTYTRKKRTYNACDPKMGNDINSTGSFLSDLSLTQSEDDFLDMQTSKTWKKHCSSKPRLSGVFVGGKRSRLSTEGLKSRRSSKTFKISSNDKIIAQTKVTIPQETNEPIQAESIIMEKAVSPCFSENNRKQSERYKSPIRTPTAPPLNEIITNSPVYDPKNNMRGHIFAPRTILKSYICVHCQKKIRFGSLAWKCRNCRIWTHTDCRNLLSGIACEPQSIGTPTLKSSIGSITDYAPQIPPMIPTLIVHCVHEIETRGLNEIGIYRISGSERDIKSLKEQFLYGKSLPNLKNIDIHVLCCCIKDFLRSLKEPLIPTNLWKDFCNAAQNTSEKLIKSDLLNAVERLPSANRDTLAFLILHFQRIAHCPEIKMPVDNLAKIFGPTIVGYSQPDPHYNDIYTETVTQLSIMENLLKIPTDYWQPYISIDHFKKTFKTLYSDDNSEDILKFETFQDTPKKQIVRKRRFYATPPYTNKKK